MKCSMKKNLISMSIAAITTLLSVGHAYATEGGSITVNFTANVREMTCDMKISGGVGSDTAQTLTLGTNGQVRLDDVKAGTASSTFKLVMVDCPSSLASIKTTVKGQQAWSLATGFVNQIPKASGGADYAAVEIARESTPNSPFVVNSTADAERLVWTSAEIANKEVQLVATLRETQTNMMTIGEFQTVATFEFTYE